MLAATLLRSGAARRPVRGLAVDGIVLALLALTAVTLPLLLFTLLPAVLIATFAGHRD